MSKTQSTISKLAKKSFRWLTGGDDGVCPAFVGWSGTQFGSLAGEKEASENSVVMACVYWAMRNVAQASFFIEQLDQGEWSRVDGHLAEQMLRSPQALLPMNQRSGFNGSKLLSALTYSRMMSGNAYLLKLA